MIFKIVLVALALALAAAAAAATAAASSSNCDYLRVDLAHGGAAVSELDYFTVSAIAGLLNRNTSNSSHRVYTYINSPVDQQWEQRILAPFGCKATAMSPRELYEFAFGGDNVIKNVVLYSDTNGTDLYPSVMTMCGVLDAVPMTRAQLTSLTASFPRAMKNTRVVLDTRGLWTDVYAAVNYTIDHALAKTTTLAFCTGANTQGGRLVDLVVARRMFAQYLPNACVPSSAGNAVLARAVKHAPWAREGQLVSVWGYNGQDKLFGGDMFEAETWCANTHGQLGQIASDGFTNGAFLSTFRRFDDAAPRGSPLGKLVQPQANKQLVYDPSKRYLATVSGDNDNLCIVNSFASRHMVERQAYCAANISKCWPMSWTMSPHAFDAAPQMLRWYYGMAARSGGRDTFMLPPSGFLYSYPAETAPALQAQFVAGQDAATDLMDTTSSELWDWFFDWSKDWKFLERFVRPQRPQAPPRTRNFALRSTPWVVPILPMFLTGEYTKIIGNVTDPETNVFASRPFFSMLSPGGGGGFNLTARQAAAWLRKIPKGECVHIYIIQNTEFSVISSMMELLEDDPSIEVVSFQDLGELARQRAMHLEREQAKAKKKKKNRPMKKE